MSTDYTTLITSEHQKPNFLAWVATLANNAAALTSLIQSLPSLFDLDNAVGQQLDFVGKWIGFARQVNGILAVGYFGFADDATALGFTELSNPTVGGRWIELNEGAAGSAILQDPEYRTVLQAKILQNMYDGTIAELEAAMADVTGVPCQYFDPGNTTSSPITPTRSVMILVSEVLDPVLTAILSQYDILPRPAGIRYQLVYPVTGEAWSTAGTANVSGTTITKPTGNQAWDSSAFVASPANHIYVEWTIPQATGFAMMGGLASNPSGSPNYPSLNYGIYIPVNGGIQIYESGTQVYASAAGVRAAGDTFAVYFDGEFVVYLHNGDPIRVVPQAAASFDPMFCLYSTGVQVTNVILYTA